MMPRVELLRLPLSTSQNSLPIDALQYIAKRRALAICELMPEIKSTLHFNLRHDISASGDDLQLVLFLEPSPQLLLSLDPTIAQSSTSLLQSHAARVHLLLNTLQDRLDCACLSGRNSAALQELLQSLRNSRVTIWTGGLRSAVVVTVPPVRPQVNECKGILRLVGRVKEAKRGRLSMNPVSLVSGRIYYPLKRTTKLWFDHSEDDQRVFLLANVAVTTGTELVCNVLEMTSPIARQVVGYQLVQLINADELDAQAREILREGVFNKTKE